MSSGIVVAVVAVLVVIVALAAASYFRHMLAATVVLLATPIAVLLYALVGARHTVIAMAALAILAGLIHTITDTARLLTTPSRRNPHAAGALGERHGQARGSKRSRIAA